MRRIVWGMLMAAALAVPARAAEGTDTRQFVKMPPMMQAHLLANMRDHLQTLNAIIADIAAEKYDAAGKLAEARLGMDSLGLHGAAHLAKVMPPGMRQLGTQMHEAASRFALKAQEADVTRDYASMRGLFQALNAITANCAACHAAYRIR